LRALGAPRRPLRPSPAITGHHRPSPAIIGARVLKIYTPAARGRQDRKLPRHDLDSLVEQVVAFSHRIAEITGM